MWWRQISTLHPRQQHKAACTHAPTREPVHLIFNSLRAVPRLVLEPSLPPPLRGFCNRARGSCCSRTTTRDRSDTANSSSTTHPLHFSAGPSTPAQARLLPSAMFLHALPSRHGTTGGGFSAFPGPFSRASSFLDDDWGSPWLSPSSSFASFPRGRVLPARSHSLRATNLERGDDEVSYAPYVVSPSALTRRGGVPANAPRPFGFIGNGGWLGNGYDDDDDDVRVPQGRVTTSNGHGQAQHRSGMTTITSTHQPTSAVSARTTRRILVQDGTASRPKAESDTAGPTVVVRPFQRTATHTKGTPRNVNVNAVETNAAGQNDDLMNDDGDDDVAFVGSTPGARSSDLKWLDEALAATKCHMVVRFFDYYQPTTAMRQWEHELASLSPERITVAPVRYTSRRQVGPRCGYVCATIVARLLARAKELRRAGVSFGHDLLYNPDWGFDVEGDDNDVCENPVPVVLINSGLGKSGSSGTVHWLSDAEIASGIDALSDGALSEQVVSRSVHDAEHGDYSVSSCTAAWRCLNDRLREHWLPRALAGDRRHTFAQVINTHDEGQPGYHWFTMVCSIEPDDEEY